MKTEHVRMSHRFPKLDCEALAEACRRDGGFTVDPRTGEVPSKGYAVAVDKDHECKAHICLDWARVIGVYADLYADDLPEWGLIGGWVYKGSLYLDISELVPDRATALRLGLERDQEAVFHLDDATEIPVDADVPMDRIDLLQELSDLAR